MRPFAPVLALLVLSVALPSLAEAPPAALLAARKHLDDLELPAALKALDAVERLEGNSRSTVLEALLLRGVVHGTMGKAPKARDAFRTLLLLDPGASLPADVPPRVRAPFQEAQTWALAQGPTVATGEEVLGEEEVLAVRITVAKDVQRLARAARFHLSLDGVWRTVEAPLIGGQAEVPVTRSRLSWWAEVLGERSATLLLAGSLEAPRTVAVEPRPAAGAVAAAPSPAADPPEVSTAPAALAHTWRRPTGFALLGAGALGAGLGAWLGSESAAGFARVASATRDLDGRVTGLTQVEAASLEATARGQATAANVLFGVGGALGVAGLVLAILGPVPEAPVVLVPAPGGAAVVGAF